MSIQFCKKFYLCPGRSSSSFACIVYCLLLSLEHPDFHFYDIICDDAGVCEMGICSTAVCYC